MCGNNMFHSEPLAWLVIDLHLINNLANAFVLLRFGAVLALCSRGMRACPTFNFGVQLVQEQMSLSQPADIEAQLEACWDQSNRMCTCFVGAGNKAADLGTSTGDRRTIWCFSGAPNQEAIV